MSTTTYYEFNKPDGTDLVNPLVDTNPNWDALDADLHEFNERSIANCTEIVTLGVHAISRLDTTAKFLKWIATANFTAGETFTVDGLAVAASTPAGASLATGAYVTGSVVLACLNADNTAMTVFVSGTTVASDAERLGGELPAYYAKQSDMTTAESNITNLQNKMGNTSIVGIGDGTATGAISAINADLSKRGRYILWENPSPTVSFSAQTISLTDSATNYDEIKVLHTPIANANPQVRLFSEVPIGVLGRLDSSEGSEANGMRNVTISNNTATFEGCYIGSSVNNIGNVPLVIYGIKY